MGQVGRGGAGGGPDEGDGLREVADEVVGQGEEFGVGAGFGEGFEGGGFGAGEVERAGYRRERVAAFGVRAGGEIGAQEGDFGVAAGGVEQALQQVREGFHSSSP